ncbi:hypothetical protein AQUCO_05700067v1 [Aquilegia coerulea]|uniref:Uncharacterized protein n=1 Tax=Aquilegia coerulea TaxID=218851 RepID=A0A2G5CFU2_AQUCA|nr:hypothetical protein AQUCO_05700067v1 [Aquilegia coerulea]
MQPFFPHTKFFSSLKQVEKRLKSEHDNQQGEGTSSSSSLSAPLYLYNTSYDQENQVIINTQEDLDSNPPQEFISHHSSTFDDIQAPSNVVDDEVRVVDHGKNDIQEVLQHLGLLGIENKEMGKSEMKNLRSEDDGNGGIGSFYSKIVGVKGPKNEKEMDRLDGWIKYFLSNNDDEGINVMEPLRLIHLLIGKAVVIANEEKGDSNGDGGFGDMEFP